MSSVAIGYDNRPLQGKGGDLRAFEIAAKALIDGAGFAAKMRLREAWERRPEQRTMSSRAIGVSIFRTTVTVRFGLRT